MNKIITFLQGKKTYIIAALMFIAAGGQALKWWTMDQEIAVSMLLAPFGLAFLRSGVDTAVQKGLAQLKQGDTK